MITLEDVRADKREFTMHMKLARGGSIYCYRGVRFPRLELQVSREHSRAEAVKVYRVDGWECRDTDEIVRRLNEEPRAPPPPGPSEEMMRRFLSEEVAKLHRRDEIMDPANVAKELDREIGERYRVYLKQMIGGKMSVRKAAERIVILERLRDHWAGAAQEEAAKHDLFGAEA